MKKPKEADDGGVERALRVVMSRTLWVCPARRDDEGVYSKGLDIEHVDVDDGELVVGNGQEELVVEGVDEPELVLLAGLHRQLERFCCIDPVQRT